MNGIMLNHIHLLLIPAAEIPLEKGGRTQLETELEDWDRISTAVALVLR